jgi:NADH:ubiquinone oxidoreductase subunit 6 (subunit J)
VLLIGAGPEQITSGPLVLFIYALIVLLVVTAVTSVMVRDPIWSIGAFASAMALVALLYLTIAPILLFAVQLIVYTSLSAGLLLGLLRRTAGLQGTIEDPFSRQWITGGAVAGVLLALLVVALGLTAWPGPVSRAGIPSFTPGPLYPLGEASLVALATLAILFSSAALGAGLALVFGLRPGRRGAGQAAVAAERRRPRRRDLGG